jgi:hypothetical protein
VEKGQFCGVKGMAANERRRLPIQIVAQNGATEPRKVNPKLMGSSRQRLAEDKGVSILFLQNAIMCAGKTATLAFLAVFPQDHTGGGSALVGLDDSLGFGQSPPKDGYVFFSDLSPFHSLPQACGGNSVFCNEKKSAGISV